MQPTITIKFNKIINQTNNKLIFFFKLLLMRHAEFYLHFVIKFEHRCWANNSCRNRMDV